MACHKISSMDWRKSLVWRIQYHPTFPLTHTLLFLCNGVFLTESEQTKYKVSLRYPELLPVMRYANNPETRGRLDVANGKKCMDKNASLLEDVVSLRKGKLVWW